jgi:hypothetical protein
MELDSDKWFGQVLNLLEKHHNHIISLGAKLAKKISEVGFLENWFISEYQDVIGIIFYVCFWVFLELLTQIERFSGLKFCMRSGNSCDTHT